MDLVLGTLTLRPYVFAFLALFVAAGSADLGWRRTTLFGVVVWPIAWLAEFSSTRTGFPFGLYHYTGLTRGRELYVADVPFMDALSFTFLTYASFCLARAVLVRRAPRRGTLALTAGALGVAVYLLLAGSVGGPPQAHGAPVAVSALGGRVWPGVALYYVVLAFNLVVTAWIGEWALLAAGIALHAAMGATIRYVRGEPGAAPALPSRGVQQA